MKIIEETTKIIPEDDIEDILSQSKSPELKRVEEILNKAKELKGLSLEDVGILLQIEDQDLLSELFKTAKSVKESIYGKRLVIFAPLYLTSYCVNNCLYCAFRRDNKEITRIALEPEKIRAQIEELVRQGHKRILLVCGEHPSYSSLDYIRKAIEIAYDVKIPPGEIRRVHINSAPMSVEEFKELKSFNIGVFQSFQETYHRETYMKMHQTGPKADYDWRLTTMHRAFEAGLGDVGMGVLYGLYDYKFEVLATIMHTQYLNKVYGVGPHTISIPRVEPAKGVPFSHNPPYAVDDISFKKLVAILRLSVPYTGIILTTRESPEMRNEVIHYGVSQMSAGSRTTPGGYRPKTDEFSDDDGQFFVADHRPLDEVVQTICKDGFLPSFCTACYRVGRVGEDFMSIAKPGDVKNLCLPNALSTFKEYLIDYASPETKKVGEIFIADMLDNLSPETQKISQTLLSCIQNGERDCFI